MAHLHCFLQFASQADMAAFLSCCHLLTPLASPYNVQTLFTSHVTRQGLKLYFLVVSELTVESDSVGSIVKTRTEQTLDSSDHYKVQPWGFLIRSLDISDWESAFRKLTPTDIWSTTFRQRRSKTGWFASSRSIERKSRRFTSVWLARGSWSSLKGWVVETISSRCGRHQSHRGRYSFVRGQGRKPVLWIFEQLTSLGTL